MADARSDLVLLWLWYRLVAVAPIGPLAWEPPYADGAALEKTKKKNLEISVQDAVSVFQSYYTHS